LKEVEGLATLVDLRKNMKQAEKQIADKAIKHHLYILSMKDTAVIDPDKHVLLLPPLVRARSSMEEQDMDATEIGGLIVTRLEALNKHRYLSNPCCQRPPSLTSFPRRDDANEIYETKDPAFPF